MSIIKAGYDLNHFLSQKSKKTALQAHSFCNQVTRYSYKQYDTDAARRHQYGGYQWRQAGAYGKT